MRERRGSPLTLRHPDTTPGGLWGHPAPPPPRKAPYAGGVPARGSPVRNPLRAARSPRFPWSAARAEWVRGHWLMVPCEGVCENTAQLLGADGRPVRVVSLGLV